MPNKSFTPGPWIYDIHEHSFYIFTKDQLDMIADGDPDDVGIARMRGVGRGADAPEQEANARLIAAAPELLDACRELTVAIVAIKVRLGKPRDEREREAVEELYRLFTKGGDAIKKAEGVE